MTLSAFFPSFNLSRLSDNTIPQLLNRNQTSLAASETLAIVHLPAALKVFFAPLVDYGAQKIPGGHGLEIELNHGGWIAVATDWENDDSPVVLGIAMESYGYMMIYTFCWINIDPENHQVLEETNLPIPICQGLC